MYLEQDMIISSIQNKHYWQNNYKIILAHYRYFFMVADDHTLMFSMCIYTYYYQRKTFQKYSFQYLFRFCNLYLFTFPPNISYMPHSRSFKSMYKRFFLQQCMYKTCKEIAQKENTVLHLTMLLHTTVVVQVYMLDSLQCYLQYNTAI